MKLMCGYMEETSISTNTHCFLWLHFFHQMCHSHQFLWGTQNNLPRVLFCSAGMQQQWERGWFQWSFKLLCHISVIQKNLRSSECSPCPFIQLNDYFVLIQYLVRGFSQKEYVLSAEACFPKAMLQGVFCFWKCQLNSQWPVFHI